MKQLLIFAFLLMAVATRAQVFQGTITWSMKYDIKDPEQKAKMEKAQKQMADPANQEKMKKMQEQMNTPEMKAMMDANPQMKARMEAALAMAQGGNGGSMTPSSFVVKTNGSSSLTKMEGGIMAMEMLYMGDKQQAYTINRTAKTYSLLSASGTDRKRDSVQHKITKTNETMKILGYTCTKYIVDITTEHGTASQFFWTTNEIKGLDMKNMARHQMGNGGQSFYYAGMDGVPLRVEMPNPKMTMVMEVTDIKKESLPATDFTLPDGFTETKGLLGN